MTAPQGKPLGPPPAPPSSAPIVNSPAVVLWLAGALVAVHAALGFAPAATRASLYFKYGLNSYRFLGDGADLGSLLAATPTLLTHAFLHGSWPHVLMNAAFLVAFGTPLARIFAAFNSPRRGAWRFVAYFGLCVLAGGLVSLLGFRGAPALSIGASGGVYGLFGGVLRAGFMMSRASGEKVLGVVDRRLAGPIALVFLLAVLQSQLLPSAFRLTLGEALVDWRAHLGGFFFGLAAFPYFAGRGFVEASKRLRHGAD